jgi:hypothetical protein
VPAAPETLATRSPSTGAPEWLRLLAWWVASVVAAVAHNGLWATPNLAFWSLIAEHPGANPFTPEMSGDYLLTNLSLTSVAAWTGQTAPYAYARLLLLVLVVAWAAVVALAWHTTGYRVARTLTVVLAGAPLVTVSMQWLGQPDPLTGLCGVAMVLVRRRWAVAVLGVVAGLTHPEQAVLMALVAAAVRPLVPLGDEAQPAGTRTPTPWWPAAGLDVLAAVGGVVVGRLCTQVVFLVADVTVRTPRTDYLRFGLGAFWEHHTRQPLGLLWTLWGPLWLVIAGLACALWWRRRSAEGDAGGSSDRRLALAAALAALAALLPVAVTLDETRVYAVVSAPLLVVLATLATRLVAPSHEPVGRQADALGRATAGFLALLVVVPGGFATGVTSWRSQLATPDMILFLRDGTLPDGSAGDVTGWLIGPFDFVIPELPAD